MSNFFERLRETPEERAYFGSKGAHTTVQPRVRRDRLSYKNHEKYQLALKLRRREITKEKAAGTYREPRTLEEIAKLHELDADIYFDERLRDENS